MAAFINVGGVPKEVRGIYICTGGVMKPVKSVLTKKNGTVVQVYAMKSE